VQKQAPTLGRLLVLFGFTLSCVGLLLFLWLAFGGPIPFTSKGYRISIPFDEAGQLSVEADVRISGVRVGAVKSIDFDRERGLTDASVEIDPAYAPLPADARAILRQKTLLGETYVEITPGSPGGRTLPEGGRLRPAAVGTSVELDEILRSLDARTRKDFQSWMQRQSEAIGGRGRDISDALGNLAPLAEDSTELLTVLSSQEGAVSRLVSNTGAVFDALGERRGQLRGLVESSDRVFAATARRDAQLREVFRILPTFEAETATTLRALTVFGEDAGPLVTQLRPAARELTPALVSAQRLAPDLRNLFESLGPLVDASEDGLPAVSDVLDALKPLLGQLDPWLREFNPAATGLGFYKDELNAFFTNVVAVTQATNVPEGGREEIRLHYARASSMMNVAGLSAYPRRIGSNRPNPFPYPGFENGVGGTPRVFEDRHCGRGDPALSKEPSPLLPDDLRALIEQFAYGGRPADDQAQPPCVRQPAFPSQGSSCAGQTSDYPHVCPDVQPLARKP
jgi:phospholipid/cholesterol/gamma-HCH transport system substrate-binding protein